MWNIRIDESLMVGNKNSDVKAPKLIYIEGRIWELAKSRAVRNFEWANNFEIWQFLNSIYHISNSKKILFWLFSKLWNYKICWFATLENCKNFQNFTILKIIKIYYWQTHKIIKFLKLYSFENKQILIFVLWYKFIS